MFTPMRFPFNAYVLLLTILFATVPASAQNKTRSIVVDAASGAVYVGYEDPALVTRQVGGTESWAVELPQGPVLAMAVDDRTGDVYVLAGEALTRLGASTGTVESSLPLNGLPARALAVDGSGALLLGGDGFLVKLVDEPWGPVFSIDPGGSVVALAVDGEGSAFAAISASDRTVVGKLSADGSGWEFRVDLGPATPAAIACDEEAVYITGSTASPDFRTHNPAQERLGGMSDAFATRIAAADGEVLWSTYLGGVGVDAGTSVTVTADGIIAIGGYTSSWDFPGTEHGETRWHGGEDGFVVFLNAELGSVMEARYYGDTALNERIMALAMVGDEVYLAGLAGVETTALGSTFYRAGFAGVEAFALRETEADQSVSALATGGCDPVAVTNTTDALINPAVGSLRWAVATVCDGGEIWFDLPISSIVNMAGEIRLDKSVNINGSLPNGTPSPGPGGKIMLINPNNPKGYIQASRPELFFRFFFVGSPTFNGVVTLHDMVFYSGIVKGYGGWGGGGAGMGGAIFQQGGTLNITNSRFAYNTAIGATIGCCGGLGGGGFGGLSPGPTGAGGPGGALGGLGGAAGSDDDNLLGNGNGGNGADGAIYGSFLGSGGGRGGKSGWDSTGGIGGTGGFSAGGGNGGDGGTGYTSSPWNYGTAPNVLIGFHGGRGGGGGTGGFGAGGGGGGGGGGSAFTGVYPAVVNLEGEFGGTGGWGTFGGGNGAAGGKGENGKWTLDDQFAHCVGAYPYYCLSLNNNVGLGATTWGGIFPRWYGRTGTFGQGGAGAGFGGAIFALSGTLNLQNVEFDTNRALGGGDKISSESFLTQCLTSPADSCGEGRGGALFIYKGATATAKDVTFLDNIAPNAGTDTLSRRDYDGYSRLPGEGQRQCPGVDNVNVCGKVKVVVDRTPDVHIDAPLSGSAISGSTLDLSGWAIDSISEVGVPLEVVLVYVDGVYTGGTGSTVNPLVYGDARPDVCAAYPGRPNCPNVGFHYTLDTSGFSGGSHVIRVEAYSTGNEIGSAEVTVIVDLTPPIIIGPSIVGTLGTNGWYTSDVTLSWQVSDPESGIRSSQDCDTRTWTADTPIVPPLTINGRQFGGTPDPGVIVSCRATNGAGLSNADDGYDGYGPVFRIDKTKPIITLSATTSPGGAPYDAGTWTNQDVAVAAACADGASWIQTSTVAGATVTTEGNGQSVTSTGACIDGAGLVADPATFSDIRIERTKPIAVPAPSPLPNANGWNNSDVTVAWQWSDAGGSGIDPAGCTTSSTSTGEGHALLLTATCGDMAGNISSASHAVKVDKTKPMIVVPADFFAVGESAAGVIVSFAPPTAADSLSDVATFSCSHQSGDLFPLGTTAVSCTAVDVAGNTQRASFLVTVRSAKAAAQAVFDTLDDLSTGVRKIDDRIAKAVDSITESLTDVPKKHFWIDEFRIGGKNADEIFTLQRKAVSELMKIKKAPDSVNDSIHEAILDIVAVARLIAQTAIDDAVSNGGNSKRIAKANEKMAKAIGNIVKGHYDRAIDEYRNAWKEAKKS